MKTLPPNIEQAVNALLSTCGMSLADLRGKTDENSSRYFSLLKAVNYSGLQRWTLHRFTKAGELPVIKLSDATSGRVLYDKADLDKLMQSLKRKAVKS